MEVSSNFASIWIWHNFKGFADFIADVLFFFNYYLNSVLFKHKEERKSFRWITIIFFSKRFCRLCYVGFFKEKKMLQSFFSIFSHWTNPNDIRWRQPLKKKENKTNQTLPPVVCVCEIVPFRIALFTLDQPLTELFSIWIPNEYDSITIRHKDKMRKKATGLMWGDAIRCFGIESPIWI